jgi:ribosome-binding factor A
MAKKPAHSGAKAPSQRMLRVGELIRHKLAELLTRGEVHDDTLASHIVTIPEVRLTPDLRIATVYVMPLGGSDVKLVIEALKRNTKFIRAEVAHALNLRYAPELRFVEDETFEEATRIDRLLDSPKVRQDVEKKD